MDETGNIRSKQSNEGDGLFGRLVSFSVQFRAFRGGESNG